MSSRRGFLGAVAAAVAASRELPASAQGFSNQVNVAVLCPLSGPQRQAGEQLANGVRGAIDDANRTRTALDKFWSIRTFDDEDSIASALLQSRFAIADQNLSLAIGHLSGKITDLVVRYYAEAGMPLIVPATSYDPITAHGYRTVFRLPTKDSVEGILHAKYVKREGRGKRIAVCYQNGDYGPDVANAFMQQTRADGFPVADVQLSYDRPDFAGAAQTALAQKPDLVFLAGLARDLGPIVPALRSAGYTGSFDGSQGFFDGGVPATYGNAVEGLTISSSMPPLNIVPAAMYIKNDFEQRYGALGPLSAFGYAATQIFVTAVRRVSSTQRITLARTIAQPIAFDTLVGSFTFDPFGDTSDPNVYFYQLQNGNWRYQRAAHPSSFIVR